jgi:hypothetical protein
MLFLWQDWCMRTVLQLLFPFLGLRIEFAESVTQNSVVRKEMLLTKGWRFSDFLHGRVLFFHQQVLFGSESTRPTPGGHVFARGLNEHSSKWTTHYLESRLWTCGANRPQCLFFHVIVLKYTLCSKSNSTKSPTSGASNVSEPRLMSQVGRVREIVCA